MVSALRYVKYGVYNAKPPTAMESGGFFHLIAGFMFKTRAFYVNKQIETGIYK